MDVLPTSLLFDPPDPQINGRPRCFATFLTFRAAVSSFFYSSLLLVSAFHLSKFDLKNILWRMNFVLAWKNKSIFSRKQCPIYSFWTCCLGNPYSTWLWVSPLALAHFIASPSLTLVFLILGATLCNKSPFLILHSIIYFFKITWSRS